MMQNNFIKSTNQIWKIVLSLSIMVFLGFVLIFNQWFGEGIDLFAGKLWPVTLVGVIATIWGCFSVKCPNCGTKLLYYAISKIEHNSWITWLFTFRQCPECEYVPMKKQRE
nr:hypothetical protein [uncultured bacterium]